MPFFGVLRGFHNAPLINKAVFCIYSYNCSFVDLWPGKDYIYRNKRHINIIFILFDNNSTQAATLKTHRYVSNSNKRANLALHSVPTGWQRCSAGCCQYIDIRFCASAKSQP